MTSLPKPKPPCRASLPGASVPQAVAHVSWSAGQAAARVVASRPGMKSFGIFLVSAGVIWVAAVTLFKLGSQRTWDQAWNDLLPEVLRLLGL